MESSARQHPHEEPASTIEKKVSELNGDSLVGGISAQAVQSPIVLNLLEVIHEGSKQISLRQGLTTNPDDQTQRNAAASSGCDRLI